MALSADLLRSRVASLFRQDPDAPLPDETFDRIAQDVFAFQLEHNLPYAAYCRRRAIASDTISHWTEIPPVPTAAFREVNLVAGDASDVEAVFQTSGTTRGPERRGRHLVRDLRLYHESLLPNFQAHVLPDQPTVRFISLVPSARDLPDSSLSRMIDVVLHHFGGGHQYMNPESGLREEELERELADCISTDTPVCLLGTSFAFVHWLDSLSARNRRFELPEGSRLMDTGGFKGRSRTVPEAELRKAYHDRLRLPEPFCVNEYGMTELLSQFYDDSLRATTAGRSPTQRRKHPPPWVRTRAVDPEALSPVPAGETGILQHFDLANLFSVMAVQTEDLGRVYEDGFETLGRSAGAVPRGCSVAVDLLLEAVRNPGR